MQTKTIFYLISRKSPHDEDVEKRIMMIEEGKKMGLNEWQIKQLYYTMYLKAVEEVGLNDKTKAELKELEEGSEPTASTSPTTP